MEFFENLNKKLEFFRKDECFKDYIYALESFYNKGFVNYNKPIDYELYMDYFLGSGERYPYERVYFEVRKRLTASVILYLYYSDEKYLKEVNNLIWMICGEVTWVLPAHAQFHNAEDISQRIDLFSAETGRFLAEIYHILNASLPEEIKKLIKSKVEHRIFDAFESDDFGWEHCTSNWAAVCGGSVGMAYMYLAPQRFEGVKQRILKTMDSFLAGYGDDGCCTEGIHYWDYGFGYFIYFADALYRFTDGNEDIRHSKKVENIALYIQKTVLREGVFTTFSDTQAKDEFKNVGLYCYLAENYEGYKMPKTNFEKLDREQYKLSVHLRNVLWYNKKLTVAAPIDMGVEYFENAQWYINRKKNYSLAAKAGHNDEEHNHNDVGSFIVATDKGQILADIGAMIYNKDTFSSKRYELLQNSSLGHSVPVVNGKAQSFGKEFCGKVLAVAEDEFVFEMGCAYGLKSDEITRSFELKENGFMLKDTFKLENNSVVERFVTPFKPEINGDEIILPDLTLKAKGFKEISKHTLVNHYAVEEDYYFIDYMVENDNFTLEVVVSE